MTPDQSSKPGATGRLLHRPVLDGLHATDGDHEAAALPATGTYDVPPTYPRTGSSANERDPVQSGASNVVDDPIPFDTRKSLRGEEKRNAAHPEAPPGKNADDRTRTCNLRFRRPMLYPIELHPQGGPDHTAGGSACPAPPRASDRPCRDPAGAIRERCLSSHGVGLCGPGRARRFSWVGYRAIRHSLPLIAARGSGISKTRR